MFEFRFNPGRFFVTALFLGCIAMAGCVEPAGLGESELKPSGDVCCIETDPFPEADGIYVASFVTPAACASYYINDSDQDGFDDTCEYRLAKAFAPQLLTHPLDQDLTREPYWALHYISAFDGAGRPIKHIRVVYLFAWHMDMGNSFDCVDGPFSYCQPHYGDSEFVFFDISYNPDTRHWLLERGFLSAHWQSPAESSSYVADASLSYGYKHRGYPNIWIARDKHANYANPFACNSGALFDADDCSQYGVHGRLEVFQSRNVGNSAHPLIDQTSSLNPVTYPNAEYFWTPSNFCGWNVVTLWGCAGQYRTALLFSEKPDDFIYY